MKQTLTQKEIAEAVDEIITGRFVKRTKHSLVWEDQNISDIFKNHLLQNKYEWKTIHEANIPIGFRCPAFVIRDLWAYFGWVKWMKYSEGVYWKYFGSEIRNPSGSYLLLITSDDLQKIYVNDRIQEETDPDAPPVYE
jgi:hypothetical protein